MMKKTVFFAVFILGCLAAFSQKPQKIKWLTVNEAQQLQQKEQKKIFIDVYTDWCGWCKKMDANTFNHPVISKLLTKYYHCVKLDAENGDTIYDDELDIVEDFTASCAQGKEYNRNTYKQ